VSDLIHGGDLVAAQARYGIPARDWLDLSTGINPVAYPLPALSADLFQRLPYQTELFQQAAHQYYGAEGVACNGTQQVIELLPSLLPALPVLLPACGYQEHRHSWQSHQNPVRYYPADDQAAAIERIEQQLQSGEGSHLLLINPNNPSGLRFSPEQIYRWASQLQPGASLIVDEAFIDIWPEQSVLSDAGRFAELGNLVVLRSFGKFFGLAGIRLGFVFANPALQQQLQTALGPWAVNGPAQGVATAAFNDRQWQQMARQQIQRNAQRTAELWQPLFERVGARLLCPDGLFISALMATDTARMIYQRLAEQGVLVRLVQGPELNPLLPASAGNNTEFCLLRSGLIDAEQPVQRERLERAIGELAASLR